MAPSHPAYTKFSGLPSGSVFWCPSSLSCAGAHYSASRPRLLKWLLGSMGFFCSASFWVVGFFLRAFLLGRLVSRVPDFFFFVRLDAEFRGVLH